MNKIKIFLLVIFVSMGVLFFTVKSGNNSEDSSLPGSKFLVETDHGDILLKIYDKTPLHQENFKKLVKDGFYDGVLFHRVIEGFMIQTGDPDSKGAEPGEPLGRGGPGYTIEAEFKSGLFHKKGALAAARQGDQVNPKKRSSGSQFYIIHGRVFSHQELDEIENHLGRTFSKEERKAYTTVGGAPHLDGEYTIFGEVVKGLDVVDKIAAVETNRQDRPTEDIRILQITAK